MVKRVRLVVCLLFMEKGRGSRYKKGLYLIKTLCKISGCGGMWREGSVGMVCSGKGV